MSPRWPSRLVKIGLAVLATLATILGLALIPAGAATGDIVVMAAGDIACNPDLYAGAAAGNGTKICAHNRVAQQIEGAAPNWVLALGDNQYKSSTTAELNASYNPTWGRFKNITYPTVGNHEWMTANAQGYRNYFATGAAPGVRTTPTYYSADLVANGGRWHLISLDSDCSDVGGCGVGSAQYTFMKNDLAAHNGVPTILTVHEPRFSSTASLINTAIAPLWNLAVADTDVQFALSGHVHSYERFAKMGTSGPSSSGLPLLVVGTGGKEHQCTASSPRAPGSAVVDCTAFGAIKLTLHADGSWAWNFHAVPNLGSTFADSGTAVHR